MNTGRPSNPLIIVTSDEPLGEVGNSHQHYFDVISKKYETVFVQPPVRWSMRNWFGGNRGLMVHSDKSAVFQYVNYFPVSLFRVFFTGLNDRINCFFLARHIGKRKEDIICWKFDSFRMMKVRFLPVHKTIYHVVDPVFRKDTDPYVARHADLIVVVNRAYFDNYSRYCKPMIYIPHGVRTEDFTLDPGRREALRAAHGDYFLVTGSVNNDVNLHLLRLVALRYTSHTLLIVGNSFLRDPVKVAEFERLIALPNVTFTGLVPYTDLKHYVAGSRLCMVPYQSLRPGFYRNPIKITNYIAQYKPVVNTVKMPELAVLENKIVFTSTGEQGFLDLIQEVLDGVRAVDTDFVADYLRDHNYEVLVEKILSSL